MSEFGGLWKDEINQHALVLPKTECGCSSGGGIKNGHIRYPSYGGMQKERKRKILGVLFPWRVKSGWNQIRGNHKWHSDWLSMTPVTVCDQRRLEKNEAEWIGMAKTRKTEVLSAGAACKANLLQQELLTALGWAGGEGLFISASVIPHHHEHHHIYIYICMYSLQGKEREKTGSTEWVNSPSSATLREECS